MLNLNRSPMPDERSLPPVVTLLPESTTFAGWIQHQADIIKAQNTNAADWLAAKIEELAVMANVLNCRSAAEYQDREEALERLYRNQA